MNHLPSLNVIGKMRMMAAALGVRAQAQHTLTSLPVFYWAANVNT